MTEPQSDSDALYEVGRQKHETGDLDGARDIYLQVLSAQEDHADALHALANLDLRTGDAESAERLARRALAANPTGFGIHNTLGNVMAARGRIDEAAREYRAELELRPDFAIAHHQIGLLHMQAGRLNEAVARFRKAIHHAPNFAEACISLGRALNNLRQTEQAIAAFEHARRLQPDNAEIRNFLGHVHRSQGDLQQARRCFERAVELDPSFGKALSNLGGVALSLGDEDAALQFLQRAAELDPRDVNTQFNLGVLLQAQGFFDQAAERFRNAVRLSPRFADAHCNLGAALQFGGDLDGAEASFRHALSLEPANAAALAGLAGVFEMAGKSDQAHSLLAPVVKAGDASPAVIGAYSRQLQRRGDAARARSLLDRALAQPGLSDTDAVNLHFQYGDLLDADRDYAAAFEHYARGNALKPSNFDPDAYQARLDAIAGFFTARTLQTLPGSACPDARPVFIVGMPRSGTTLVEQVIDSHPAARGAGELRDIGMLAAVARSTHGNALPFPEFLRQVDDAEVANLAQRYLQRLDEIDARAERICDKMWRNFEYLGWIQMLFPRARVIHCRRDPRDVGLSCYTQNFLGVAGLQFYTDLGNIGRFYTACSGLMFHWDRVLSLPVHTVHYEDFVADQEAETWSLLDFLDLPRDPACLRFFESGRVAVTASYDQVRQPVYDASVGRHRHYTAQLGPLFAALEH